MKAVFDTRPGSGYLDSVERYQFPSRYLQLARGTVGDWAVFYEPTREKGRRAYVAVARVTRVDADAEKPGSYFAYLGDYLPFDTIVPLSGPEGYREAPLREVSSPKDIGRALQGRSVRALAEEDFASIVSEGLQRSLNSASEDTSEELDEFPSAKPTGHFSLNRTVRPIERQLVSRITRDAAFRSLVIDAYDATCAVTGMKIVSSGGSIEAQAAHIIPVSHGGADIVQNGVALSSTAHWLFDQNLIAIGEEAELLVSRSVLSMLPATLFKPGKRLLLPFDMNLRPLSECVAYHRARFVV